MDPINKRWILSVVIINFVVNFLSISAIGGVIKSLTDEKYRLDRREPSDSNYIGDVVFFFACLITTFGAAVVVLEFITNLIFFLSIKQGELSTCKCRFFIWTNVIVTIIIGSVGWSLFLTNNENVMDYLFHTSEIDRLSPIVILIPWGIRIIYAIISTGIVFACYRNDRRAKHQFLQVDYHLKMGDDMQ